MANDPGKLMVDIRICAICNAVSLTVRGLDRPATECRECGYTFLVDAALAGAG